MGFDIDSLVGKSVETLFPFANEEVKVWYDPNVLTRDRITAAESGDQNFLEFFCDLVTDWEVTQGGKKVPLKPDALSPIPFPFLRGVFVHIIREGSSGELGKLSDGHSRRREPKDRMAPSRKSPSSTGSSRQRGTSG